MILFFCNIYDILMLLIDYSSNLAYITRFDKTISRYHFDKKKKKNSIKRRILCLEIKELAPIYIIAVHSFATVLIYRNKNSEHAHNTYIVFCAGKF